VLSQRGTAGRDPFQDCADRSGDVDARALGGGSRVSLAPAEADGARELVAEEFDLAARARGALAVVESFGLVELVAQVFQSLLVGGARRSIEDFAGVARGRSGEGSTDRRPDQIEDAPDRVAWRADSAGPESFSWNASAP
jgi:hypothetical protein